MMYKPSEEDNKKFDIIQKWLIRDETHNLVFREDTPDSIRKERERLLKKYYPFD